MGWGGAEGGLFAGWGGGCFSSPSEQDFLLGLGFAGLGSAPPSLRQAEHAAAVFKNDDSHSKREIFYLPRASGFRAPRKGRPGWPKEGLTRWASAPPRPQPHTEGAAGVGSGWGASPALLPRDSPWAAKSAPEGSLLSLRQRNQIRDSRSASETSQRVPALERPKERPRNSGWSPRRSWRRPRSSWLALHCPSRPSLQGDASLREEMGTLMEPGGRAGRRQAGSPSWDNRRGGG